jgi:hypothetical protein
MQVLILRFIAIFMYLDILARPYPKKRVYQTLVATFVEKAQSDKGLDQDCNYVFSKRDLFGTDTM